METGVLIIILLVVLVAVGLIIGLVVWLIMRKDPDQPPEEEENEGENGGGGGGNNGGGGNVDPCFNYDTTKYNKCNTIKVGNYIFKSYDFRDKKMKDTVTKRYFYNNSGAILNLFVGNSSDQKYSLSNNRITVNNRNVDNYLRAQKYNNGGVFFGWGSIPIDQIEYVFYDGSNVCFSSPNDSSKLYIMRDINGAYVEELTTESYYQGIQNGSFPAYIALE